MVNMTKQQWLYRRIKYRAVQGDREKERERKNFISIIITLTVLEVVEGQGQNYHVYQYGIKVIIYNSINAPAFGGRSPPWTPLGDFHPQTPCFLANPHFSGMQKLAPWRTSGSATGLYAQ